MCIIYGTFQPTIKTGYIPAPGSILSWCNIEKLAGDEAIYVHMEFYLWKRWVAYQTLL